MNARFPTIAAFILLSLSGHAALAASTPKQIAINASGSFFSVYREAGMSGAIARIGTCYDGAKSRDAYLFCLAMDNQAMRLERGLSARRGEPMAGYFSEDAFEQRLSVLERWYPSASQLDYAMDQLMDGLDEGTRAEAERIGRRE